MWVIETISFFEAIITHITNNDTFNLIKLFMDKGIITQAPYYESMVDLVDKLVETEITKWRDEENNILNLPWWKFQIIEGLDYLAIKEVNGINCLESKVLNILNEHFTIYE